MQGRQPLRRNLFTGQDGNGRTWSKNVCTAWNGRVGRGKNHKGRGHSLTIRRISQYHALHQSQGCTDRSTGNISQAVRGGRRDSRQRRKIPTKIGKNKKWKIVTHENNWFKNYISDERRADERRRRHTYNRTHGRRVTDWIRCRGEDATGGGGDDGARRHWFRRRRTTAGRCAAVRVRSGPSRASARKSLVVSPIPPIPLPPHTDRFPITASRPRVYRLVKPAATVYVRVPHPPTKAQNECRQLEFYERRNRKQNDSEYKCSTISARVEKKIWTIQTWSKKPGAPLRISGLKWRRNTGPLSSNVIGRFVLWNSFSERRPRKIRP